MAEPGARPDAADQFSCSERKKRSRWKWVIYAALTLAIGGLSAANSPLAARGLAQLIQKKTGAACTIDSLRTWPFSPGLTLRKVTLTRPLGLDGQWQLTVPAITGTLTLSDLGPHWARGHIVIDTLSLQRPHLHLTLPSRSAAPEPPSQQAAPPDSAPDPAATPLIPLADEAPSSPTPAPIDYETTGTGLTSLGKKKSITIDAPAPAEPSLVTEAPSAQTIDTTPPPTAAAEAAPTLSPPSEVASLPPTVAKPPATPRRKIRHLAVDSASFEIFHPRRPRPLMCGEKFSGLIPETSAASKGHGSGLITQVFGRPLELQLAGSVMRSGAIFIADQATLRQGSITGTWALQAHLSRSGYPFAFGLDMPSVELSQLAPFLKSTPGGKAKLSLSLAGLALQPKQWQGALQTSVDDAPLPLAPWCELAGLKNWAEKIQTHSFGSAQIQLQARAGGEMLVIDDCSIISPDVSWRASGLLRPTQEWVLSSRFYFSDRGQDLAQSLTADWPAERQWPLRPMTGSATSFVDLPIGGTLTQPLFSLWDRPWSLAEWRDEYLRLEKMAGR